MSDPDTALVAEAKGALLTPITKSKRNILLGFLLNTASGIMTVVQARHLYPKFKINLLSLCIFHVAIVCILLAIIVNQYSLKLPVPLTQEMLLSISSLCWVDL